MYVALGTEPEECWNYECAYHHTHHVRGAEGFGFCRLTEHYSLTELHLQPRGFISELTIPELHLMLLESFLAWNTLEAESSRSQACVILSSPSA